MHPMPVEGRRPWLRKAWRAYRVVLFPFLNALSGGGHHQSCRHQPTCSEFAVTVIEERGWLKGLWPAMRRILRCSPWSSQEKEDPNHGP